MNESVGGDRGWPPLSRNNSQMLQKYRESKPIHLGFFKDFSRFFQSLVDDFECHGGMNSLGFTELRGILSETQRNTSNFVEFSATCKSRSILIIYSKILKREK